MIVSGRMAAVYAAIAALLAFGYTLFPNIYPENCPSQANYRSQVNQPTIVDGEAAEPNAKGLDFPVFPIIRDLIVPQLFR